MKTFLLLTFMGFSMFLLGGCASTQLSSYQGTQPVMAFDQFFNGEIKGWGIVQDRKGKIINRFDIILVGKWNGDQGSLDEDFTYYDGKKMHRTWHIQKTGANEFVGRADDIIGDAPGKSVGTAIKWNYVMTIETKGKKYDIKFDDWMFQMNDNTVMNRSYMSKFGIRVGEITIFMQKK